MKSFSLLLFIFFLQVPNQQKAEKAISRHIKDITADPDGYRSIQFGKIEKFMSNFGLTGYAKIKMSLLEREIKTAEEYRKDGQVDHANVMMTDVNGEIASLKSAALAFKKKQIGWKLSHKYRQKGNFGDWQIKVDTFYMDFNYTIINLDTFTLKASDL